LQETLDSFPEVVSRLLCRVLPEKERLLHNEEFNTLNLLDIQDPWLMDAYESEALMGVCAILVKNSSSRSFFSIQNWKLYLTTFLLYLAHPASTVRQSSSMIFKELVTKNQHPNIIRLLLHSLTQSPTENITTTNFFQDVKNNCVTNT
jgi:hypothetical protein